MQRLLSLLADSEDWSIRSIPSTIEICRNVLSESAIVADPTEIHQILMNLYTRYL
jgi:hypothetical protein